MYQKDQVPVEDEAIKHIVMQTGKLIAQIEGLQNDEEMLGHLDVRDLVKNNANAFSKRWCF